MNDLLIACKQRLPHILFIESKTFYWSPKKKSIYFDPLISNDQGCWALLHESAHALLNHESYISDVGLLALEVSAWQTAEKLGQELGNVIDPDHIQDCLDTYRDWLYARSTCPTCMLNSLQISETSYLCMNCSTKWSVSPSRFCRPYRMKDRYKKTPSEEQKVFI